ncbi:Asp/Glu/hydantoin racemase [Emericellopsis atlantica]|uniref:Asp/Glu/hydantoin racemase n=1 Tax=Emericellopsis atlantica TaxID=2614577 RepID=A0A9P7ZHN2_9HYPO|nr:Asp/Glu/hydantoin racemase [Emericellopsis atlantica]KAG9252293.1 Asp/Glu/hydantoin racemase [Emericellopsis atlantica]
MSQRIKLGILTPSSNTSLEPLSQAIVADLPNVSVHFSRFTVLKIGLADDALAQFQNEKIMAAAQLLADAEVDMIGWSGTSSGWLGFEADDKLCAEITAATGIPATTSVLALNKAVKEFGVKELGLVTPYTDDVQEAIVKTYKTIGMDCSKERHLGISKNSTFATIDEPTLDGMVADVASKKVQAITTFCTNLRAAQRVAHWEKEHGIPVFDTVTTVLWEMLRELKVDTKPLAPTWGMLLAK